MSCCTPAGYRTVFGTGMAERDARRYRRKGLRGSARWLTNQAAGRGVKGRSILEIGGDIGDIQLELLHAGAAHATNMEIIDTYEDAAGELMTEAGLQVQMERRIGDVGVHPEDAPSADVVVLHRGSAATPTRTPCSPPLAPTAAASSQSPSRARRGGTASASAP